MRILYIAPRPPFPPEGRETVRPYHQIRFMALRHDVDLVCFSGGGVDEWEARERLKKLGLWGGSHKPIAPWDWRKMSKVERDEHR